MQLLQSLLVSLITIIFDLAGDFGLLFFVFINVINIYSIWWLVPKNVQTKIQANLSQSGSLLRTLNIHRTIVNVGALVIPVGIILAPGPALWLKIISSILILVVSLYLIGSLWLFVTKGISVAIPPVKTI